MSDKTNLRITNDLTYLVFVVRVEVVEVGGVPGGHVMQEERDGEVCHEKSSGK